jgi:hypothetical protein
MSYDRLSGQELIERAYKLKRMGCNQKEVAELCGFLAKPGKADIESYKREVAKAKMLLGLKLSIREVDDSIFCSSSKDGALELDLDDIVDNMDEMTSATAAVYKRPDGVEIHYPPSSYDDHPDELLILTSHIISIRQQKPNSIFAISASLEDQRLRISIRKVSDIVLDKEECLQGETSTKIIPNVERRAQSDSPRSAEESIKPTRLVGNDLLISVSENQKLTEVDQCVRAGYSFPREIGKFRREVAKAKGKPLPPMEKPLPRYRTIFTGSASKREMITSTTNRIKRGSQFRSDVLCFHGFKCLVCSQSNERLVQAAHLLPVSKEGSDSPLNGIPLCPTHHVAFDADLWCIEPDSLKVVTANGYSYESLQITRTTISTQLNHESLKKRWSYFNPCL